ncbi:MAG TPA: outer membrane beta-barrel protein [Polyangia bacterium]|nr:outer membrane beta-barrel protein [Polyangia bacterium]
MTKPLMFTATMLLVLAAARPSLAQAGPPDTPGVDVAVRVGYAVPFGDIDGDSGDSLSGTFSGAVPFVVEAGYRFDRHFTLGPYFQYAFAQVKDGSGTVCGNGVDCSGSIIRLGLQALYHLDLGSTFVPWFGLGVGYEWMNVDASSGNLSASASAHGWEFLTLELGGDIYVAPQFAVGPFISYSIARYGSGSTTLGNTTTSSDISNPAVHEWLQFGARFSFSL